MGTRILVSEPRSYWGCPAGTEAEPLEDTVDEEPPDMDEDPLAYLFIVTSKMTSLIDFCSWHAAACSPSCTILEGKSVF